MIEFANATVAKSGVILFQDFNLKIPPEENWVIQGNNGSGKTTLLQLTAGVLHPISGRVRHSFLTGNDWDTLYRQRQKKIHLIPAHGLQALVGGSDGLFYQQRYYSMGETGVPKVREVFGQGAKKLKTLGISETFNIQKLLELPVTRLSNGQLKKVIILRQLIKNIPTLLLMDYPFDGLDAESRKDFSDFIDEIAIRFGIQIIIVDHGDALPKVITRKLVLHNFKIHNIETIEARPASHDRSMKPVSLTLDEEGKQPVVEMKNLSIQYSERKIIQNLNWRINKGERWALTGRNGSGKTTLFSLIYADHPMAYSQEVYLFGRRRGTGESIWDIKRRINYFGPEQIHFLNPKAMRLTGREYILMQPHKNRDQLDKLVAFFNVQAYINRPINHLSSGQLQLVFLLNMFLDDKELLLLDEPFQFLDPESHERVTRYLNHHLTRNTTLVLITHNENDVIMWTQKRKQI